MTRTTPHLLLAALLLLPVACDGAGDIASTPSTTTSARTSAPAPTAAPAPGTKSTSTDLAALVPRGAVAYAELGSIEALDGMLRAGAGLANDPMVAGMARADTLLSMMLGGAGKTELLDRGKPLGFAVSMQAGEPQPVFFLPCTDVDGFAASLGNLPSGPAVETRGDYVAIAPGGAYTPGGSTHALAQGMLDRTFALRVDVAGIADTVRPLAEMGLGQAREMARAQGAAASDLAALESADDELDAFWDSAETLDLGFGLEAGELGVALALTAREGSELASWAAPGRTRAQRLARYFGGDEAFQLVVGADSAFFSDHVEPGLRRIAERDPAAGALVPTFSALRRMLGSTFAFGGGFGEEGLHLAVYCEPRDEAAFLDWLRAGLQALDAEAPYMELTTNAPAADVLAAAEPAGMDGGEDDAAAEEATTDGAPTADAPTSSTTAVVEGTPTVHEFVFTTPTNEAGLDPERLEAQRREIAQLFGDAGLRLRVATNDQRLALVLGGSDTEFARVQGALAAADGTEPPASMAGTFAEVGDANPSFVARLDLARLAGQGQDLVARMTEAKLGLAPGESAGSVPAAPPFDGPVPMTYYGAIEGRVFRFGLNVDVEGLARMSEAFGGDALTGF